MNHQFRLADIGEGLEEAEIISWLVKVGDVVARDQPLVEVMTDKSNAELPAPAAGTVLELGGSVGDIIHVGELIAVISPSAGTSESAPTPVTAGVSRPVAHNVEAHTARNDRVDVPQTPTGRARIKASPSTRRAAAERGIDLGSVAGSGPGGRILMSDLEPSSAPSSAPPSAPPKVQPTELSRVAVAPAVQAQPAQPTPPPQPTPRSSRLPNNAPEAAAPSPGTMPLRGIRRLVAQNMARSWSDIPHIHAFEHIDAVPLLELRERMRSSGNHTYAALTPVSFFVAAVAKAMATFPQANASIDMAEETITHHADVNVGVAVASPTGLVVPVLPAAQSLEFGPLCGSLNALVQGARAGTLERSSYLQGTATVTNFGSLGGELATPLIRPPEAVIIGFGAVADRPFVIDEEVVARKTMHLVIGADHRLIDGDIATAVLHDIAESLTDPLRLVL